LEGRKVAAQNVYTYFIESLKNRMALEGVTQVDLAKSVETSKTHFNTVLKGKKKAGSNLQKRLASYFRLSLEEMIQEGHNLLQGDKRSDQFQYQDTLTPIREHIYTPSYTQVDSNLTDLALKVAAAVKRTQDDLAKWQSIVEAIGDGVLVISAKDRIIEYQNQAHKDLFGGKIVGKRCGETPSCRCGCSNPAKKAVETGKVVHERLNLNGKTIAIIASPVRDGSGRIVRVVTTSRDVSDRQKALADVFAAEQRLLGVISLLDVPVLIFDEDNNIVFINSLVRELISANDEDLVNLETLIECLRPQIKDFDQLEMWMRNTTRSRKLEQTTVQYKSGRETTWTSKPIFSPSGIYMGRVGMSGPTT
jgi:PAS domain-containing protein